MNSLLKKHDSEKVLEDWFNHFCNNVDCINDYIDASKWAATLSYRASITRALYDPKTGKSGFQDKNAEKKFCREQGEIIIADFLQRLVVTDYTNISETICETWNDVRSIYINNGITWYTYGNAQKWVNMSVKYFIVIMIKNNIEFPNRLIENALFPVDSIMINAIKKDLCIEFIGTSWSRCDDYIIFKDYIFEVKEAVTIKKELSLFEYELCYWKNEL